MNKQVLRQGSVREQRCLDLGRILYIDQSKALISFLSLAEICETTKVQERTYESCSGIIHWSLQIKIPEPQYVHISCARRIMRQCFMHVTSSDKRQMLSVRNNLIDFIKKLGLEGDL